MQTVQTQIRRRIMWRLIRVYIVCYQDFPFKIEQKRQNRPDIPKMTNELIQHASVEESTSIQWVKWRPYLEGLHHQGMQAGFVVVALLFYVHGKHLRSCRDGQLT